MRRLATRFAWWQNRPTRVERGHTTPQTIEGGPAANGEYRARSAQAREPALQPDEEGEIVEHRIQTSPRAVHRGPGRPQARILLEASAESEWVVRHLEALGHEVIVTDPNFAPMYATRRRGVKTDRRDARTLAEGCRLGAYRRAHRASAGQRHVRAELAVRDALIRTASQKAAGAAAAIKRDPFPIGRPPQPDSFKR